MSLWMRRRRRRCCRVVWLWFDFCRRFCVVWLDQDYCGSYVKTDVGLFPMFLIRMKALRAHFNRKCAPFSANNPGEKHTTHAVCNIGIYSENSLEIKQPNCKVCGAYLCLPRPHLWWPLFDLPAECGFTVLWPPTKLHLYRNLWPIYRSLAIVGVELISIYLSWIKQHEDRVNDRNEEDQMT